MRTEMGQLLGSVKSGVKPIRTFGGGPPTIEPTLADTWVRDTKRERRLLAAAEARSRIKRKTMIRASYGTSFDLVRKQLYVADHRHHRVLKVTLDWDRILKRPTSLECRVLTQCA